MHKEEHWEKNYALSSQEVIFTLIFLSVMISIGHPESFIVLKPRDYQHFCSKKTLLPDRHADTGEA